MAESLEYSSYNSRNKSAMKADPSKFEPALHKFEVSPQVLESMVIMNLKNLEVESPDFSCLLDHAMATLWYIFENDGEKWNLPHAEEGGPCQLTPWSPQPNPNPQPESHHGLQRQKQKVRQNLLPARA